MATSHQAVSGLHFNNKAAFVIGAVNSIYAGLYISGVFSLKIYYIIAKVTILSISHSSQNLNI